MLYVYSVNDTDENAAAKALFRSEKLAKFPDKCDAVIYRLQCVIYARRYLFSISNYLTLR